MANFWSGLSAANKRMIVRVGLVLVVLVGGWIATRVASGDNSTVSVGDAPSTVSAGPDPELADLGDGVGGLDTSDDAATTGAPTITEPEPTATTGSAAAAVPTTTETSPPTTRGPPPTTAPPTTQRPVPTTYYQFSNLAAVSVDELPDEAIDTLRLIDDGGPYPYSQDDSTFGNFEGILPDQRRGYYREYTVETPGLSHRGALRIVSGSDGDLYWTDDHYDSFAEIIDW